MSDLSRYREPGDEPADITVSVFRKSELHSPRMPEDMDPDKNRVGSVDC